MTIRTAISILLAALLLSCAHRPDRDESGTTDLVDEGLFTGSIEGPAVDGRGNLFAVNFGRNGTIGRVNAKGDAELFLLLPEGSVANSIVFTKTGTMLLADYTMHNILAADTAARTVTVFSHNGKFNQPNDLCLSDRGQLFASDPHWKTGSGKLWRIDPDGSSHLLEDSMGTTNGITLSPDESVLYVNESIQRKVWKYSLHASGSISRKTLFHSFDDFGMDGMKCDAEGNLYVTRYGKGTIAVLSPEGALLREIALKGKKCSNLVFGGADGRTVFVTMQDRKTIEYFRNDIPGKGF